MTSTPTSTHTFPTEDQLVAFAGSFSPDDDPPVVMLNLNRYRDVASYGDERDEEGLSGREAYLRYGVVAQEALAAMGARVLWLTEATTPVIGCDHDTYDEVLAVWYPNRSAFLKLGDHPGYTEALQHRDAALDRAALIPCVASADARLGTPFDA